MRLLRRIPRILTMLTVAILTAGLAGVALAQGVATDPIGFVTSKAGELLGGVAAMGAWSAGITGWVRHHWLKQLNGAAVTVFAIGIAFVSTEGLVLWLHAGWTILAGIAFAVASGIFASGTLAVTIKGPLKPIMDFIYSIALKYLPKDVTAPDRPPADASGDDSGNAEAPPATP